MIQIVPFKSGYWVKVYVANDMFIRHFAATLSRAHMIASAYTD